MDINNGQVQTPCQVIGGGMEGYDWRTQLQQGTRQRIVNKILETLKRHIRYSGQEGLQELEKIAVRFEEKIYTTATSQSDYLRKISLKMLAMETKSQNPVANNSENPQDPAASQYLLADDPEILNLSSALSNMPPLGSPSMDN